MLFLVTLALLEYFAAVLASTDQLRILGGFGCSILFFWSMLIIGNLEPEPSWLSGKFSQQKKKKNINIVM